MIFDLNNFWNMHGNVFLNSRIINNTALRGGPRIMNPLHGKSIN